MSSDVKIEGTRRRKPGLRILAGGLLGILVLAGAGTWYYLSDYYRYNEYAEAAMHGECPWETDRVGDKVGNGQEEIVPSPEDAPPVAVSTPAKGRTLFLPEEPKAGVVFYPGGKVECEAYAPLMVKLAQRGFACVLVDMPVNLAFLDSDAAADAPGLVPQVQEWYLAGHSLGGVAGAAWLEKHTDEFAGLILLGSYITADLSDSGLRALSLYGSEDGVLNREAYEENRVNLPEDTMEMIIPGGCHAWFGSYGPQEGDGTPLISPEDQWEITADWVEEWITRSLM